jgi:hypothetical protein
MSLREKNLEVHCHGQLHMWPNSPANRNSHTKRCQNFFCFVSVFFGCIVPFTHSHTTYRKKVFGRDSDIQKGGLFIFYLILDFQNL